jgi:cytochrome c oxidase subunit 4
VIAGVSVALAISTGIFVVTRMYAQERPHTMSKEWREQTNEYLRKQKANPLTGMSSADYTGKGYATRYP